MEKLRTDTGQTLGIIGLILDILTLLFAFIPCIGFIALLPGVIAVTLSAIGLNQATKHNGYKGLNIGALVVSISGTLIAGIWVLFFAGLASLDRNEIKSAIEIIIDETTQPCCNPDLQNEVDVLEKKLDSLEKDSLKLDTLKIYEE